MNLNPNCVRIRKGSPLTIGDLTGIIEGEGHPEVLAIPSWAWIVIAMAIRLDAVIREEGKEPYFWMGATRVVPKLPPERLARIEIDDYDSDIITPDMLGTLKN